MKENTPFKETKQAAEFLLLTDRTLEQWRYKGIGPAFRKHGGRVVYHIDDLREWSEQQKANSTSEYQQGGLAA